MTEKIQAHVDNLLKDAPRTRRVVDLHEELLSGCLDKYADLVASGSSPEEAYDAVIAGIGDVDELLGSARKNVMDKKLLGPVSSSLWSLIVFGYLFLGFFFELWHPGWLIFLVGALLQNLLNAAFLHPDRRKGPLTGALYISATIVFLIFGFATMRWTIACLIFALAVAVQQITRLIRVWRDD
ncbi:MAG: permease prefix domain 1-containing protein [Oscillospiraceae bacterium]|nr:permease prefix domain 1-containing protein [Oscillospiraceae bacterium]